MLHTGDHYENLARRHRYEEIHRLFALIAAPFRFVRPAAGRLPKTENHTARNDASDISFGRAA